MNENNEEQSSSLGQPSDQSSANVGASDILPARRISMGRWALIWVNAGLLVICVTLTLSSLSILHIGGASSGPASPTQRAAASPTSSDSSSLVVTTAEPTATDTATPASCCAGGATATPVEPTATATPEVTPTSPPAPTPTPTVSNTN
ncbi:MAG TPA: hypothetical protein VKQ36_00435 [Ktedonobacterales bacterium]|nr:hypothetical protein [Ktedonobacterales bacterium]